MSYDPSRPEDFPPDRPEAGVPFERPGYDDAGRSVDAVRSRVQLPAIFLIVLAVINGLFFRLFRGKVRTSGFLRLSRSAPAG